MARAALAEVQPLTAPAAATESAPRKRSTVVLVLLAAVVVQGQLLVDFYLPAMPELRRNLAASDAAVQLTIVATTVGWAVGPLLAGPWSDRTGRRKPLLAALIAITASSAFAASAPSLDLLLVARFAQGIGGGIAVTVAWATISDQYDGIALVRILARLGLLTGITPILAPVIGAQLLLVTDWRGLFWCLTATGITSLAIASIGFDETVTRSTAANRASVGSEFRTLVTDRTYAGAAVGYGVAVMGMFAYVGSSALLLEGRFGLSPQGYGYISMATSAASLVAGQSSARLMRRREPQWVLTGGLVGMILSSIVLGSLALWHVGLLGVVLPLGAFVFGFATLSGPVTVLMLGSQGSRAAMASAVSGTTNSLFASVTPPLVALFGAPNPGIDGVAMFTASCMALLVVFIVMRPSTVPSLAR